jgi:hypothetical protein
VTIASAGLCGYAWRQAEGHRRSAVTRSDADALGALALSRALDGADLLGIARRYLDVDALGDLSPGRGLAGANFLAEGCELACRDLNEDFPGAPAGHLSYAFYLGVALYDVCLAIEFDPGATGEAVVTS